MVVLSVIATIAAVGALVAAGYTVKYARQTVLDARSAHRQAMRAQRRAREQFAEAHREAMAEQAQGRAQFAKEQSEGREQFASAHHEQMAERQRTLASEIVLQRLAQASRIADMLIALARTAHSETLDPPAPAAGSQRATLIPSLQAQLRAELALFYALGGPVLETSDDLADKAYSLTVQPIEMRQLAENGLGEVMRLAGRDERLKLT